MKLHFLSHLLLIAIACRAQPISQPVSARYSGLFSMSAHQVDVIAARNNPASHARLQQSSAGAYAERRFMLHDLQLFQASVGINTSSGNFGFHAGYFGFAEMNQSQLSLSYGRQITKVIDVGASFHYLQLKQSGIYGSANAITGSAGLLLHVSEQVHLGFQAYNPFRAAWNNAEDEHIASRYSFGIGYDVSEKMFVGGEIIKEENLPVDFQAGFHYAFLPQFFVRAGIATQTASYFAALGFKFPAFRIDIAGSYHPQLGWSPGILLVANIGKPKEKSSAN